MPYLGGRVKFSKLRKKNTLRILITRRHLSFSLFEHKIHATTKQRTNNSHARPLSGICRRPFSDNSCMKLIRGAHVVRVRCADEGITARREIVCVFKGTHVVVIFKSIGGQKYRRTHVTVARIKMSRRSIYYSLMEYQTSRYTTTGL